jgi:hypothetical protein
MATQPVFKSSLVLVLVLLIPASACLANPMPPFDPVFDLLFPALNPILLAIDVVSDSIVLALAYVVIGKWRIIRSAYFLRHLWYVFLAGLAIDIYIFDLARSPWILGVPGIYLAGTTRVWVILGVSTALGATNYLIAVRRPGFSHVQAVVVGVCVGFLTTPILDDRLLHLILT